MKATHFNTTNEAGEVLEGMKQAADAHQVRIEAWFKKHRRGTPSEVWNDLFDQLVPLTSVRRAITNITNYDKSPIEKTSMKQEGVYGRPEHVWRLKGFYDYVNNQDKRRNKNKLCPLIKTFPNPELRNLRNRKNPLPNKDGQTTLF